MASDVRGELAVLAVGVLLWLGGIFATGEMGRALSGGGMVFTAIGSVLVAFAILRERWRRRSDTSRGPAQ